MSRPGHIFPLLPIAALFFAGIAAAATAPTPAPNAPADSSLLRPTDAINNDTADKASGFRQSATISPSKYKDEQDSAAEDLIIHIASVKAIAAKPMDDTISNDAKQVVARAVVIDVNRSHSGLKIGSVIYLLYGYAPPAPGHPGPPPIPIVQDNTNYHAFLGGGPIHPNDPPDTPFLPVAGAQSFVDPAAPSVPGGRNPSAPQIDPALLPTPANVKPDGAIRLTGDNLTAFVQLSHTATGWVVSIAHSDPVPLQVLAGNTPSLFAYYSAPLRAPPTQPTVLIYKAGDQPDVAPATGTVSIMRALILDSQHRLLGDAIWSRIRSDDSQPPLPPLIWTWSASRLDIVDHDLQMPLKIMLTGGANPPPTPAATPANGATAP